MRLILLFSGIVVLSAAPASAVEKKTRQAFPSSLAAKVKRFTEGLRFHVNENRSEAIEMFLDLARGRGMGPGQGWYKPGQARHNWLSLVEKYDKDVDFRLTTAEFPLNSRRLRRLDRNRDGVLTRADFDFSQASPINRQLMVPRMLFRGMDQDSNGKITRDEWNKLFDFLSDKKPFLTTEDLLGLMQLRRMQRATPRIRRPSTPRRSGPTPVMIVVGMLNGELGALTQGPDLNAMAPDFVLKTQKDNRAIQLSKFRGKKPVVLIFGSFT